MNPPKSVDAAAPSTVAWWGRHGIIYFIAAGDPPVAVKIGMTTINGSLRKTVVRRGSQIQSSNHELLYLLGVIRFTEGAHPSRDAEVRERELHNEFHRLRRFRADTRGGEWFRPSRELLARIEQIATKPEALELPRLFSTASDDV
jgi:hypothetical protein